MRTRPKDLGTRLESFVVHRAQDRGLIAERLPEGAINDRGDIRIITDREWIGECKDRMSLNLPQAVAKAILKAGSLDTFVVWRKMKRKDGNTNRTQDGPIIVAITLERYLELLKGEVR